MNAQEGKEIAASFFSFGQEEKKKKEKNHKCDSLAAFESRAFSSFSVPECRDVEKGGRTDGT